VTSAWLTWWIVLCSAAAVNAAAWGYSAARLSRNRDQFSREVYATRRLLLWLSAVYVLGCGFRSVFPMVDVPRMCLHDTWISRIFAGRSVATVAELAFAAQWALLLREAAAATGSRFAAAGARLLLPLIAVAELSSWWAVLTKNWLFHAAENSLWTLGAALVVAAFAVSRPASDRRSRRFLAAAVACGLGYIAFMSSVDVPMYFARWRADLEAGLEPLAPAAGLAEVLARCVVTRDWDAWREDVPWLTLYFTLGVWISIALPQMPPLRRA
jgi:hypothetical protein